MRAGGNEKERMNRAELLACPECDLLQHDAPLPRPRKALCVRCGAVLHRRGDALELTLALTVTALVLLALANAFPILTLELQEERTTATLAGAAAALWSQNMPLVAILVLFMALVMPLAELAALAYLLVPLRRGRRASGLGTVEVFVLGALVSLVKLGHVADVEPGIALASYGALMLVMAAIEASFDPRELWARAKPA
jgi:paraquat-inducible protein A